MKKRIYLIGGIFLLIALLLYFFGSPPQNRSGGKSARIDQKSLPIEGIVKIISHEPAGRPLQIYVAVADDPYERSRGLMYRYSMPDTVGMIFLYDRPDYLNFWMKNTHIPLDIIFMDQDFKIVDIKEFTQPYSEEMIPSRKKAQFALEVNAGFVQKYGIKAGDKVVFRRNF